MSVPRLIVLALTCVLAPNVHAETGKARLKVNLREAPNLSSLIVAVLERDAEVRILDRVGEFVRVERSSDGRVGYLRERMLTLQRVPSDPSGVAPGHEFLMARTTATVNLRAKASGDSRVLEVLKPNQSLRVLKLAGDFSHVRRESDGRTGFVARKFLRMEDDPDLMIADVAGTNSRGGSQADPLRVMGSMPSIPEPVLSEAIFPAVPGAALLPSVGSTDGDIPESDGSLRSVAKDAALQTPSGETWDDQDSVQVGVFAGEAIDATNPWYVTMTLGFAVGNVSAGELESSLKTVATAVDVQVLDESSLSWMLSAGYHFSAHWAAELGVLDLGRYESRIEIRNADAQAVEKTLSRTHPAGGSGLTVGLVARHSWGAVSATGRVGVFQSQDTDINVRIDGQPRKVEGENFSFLLGSSLGYQLSSHWRSEVCLSVLELNQRILLPALRLNYQF